MKVTVTPSDIVRVFALPEDTTVTFQPSSEFMSSHGDSSEFLRVARHCIENSHKLQLIKEFRTYFNLSLLEGKKVVDILIP